MPDFFNTPDNDRVPDGAPQDWSDVFAALPLETPPDDSWLQIVHALDTRKRRGHRMQREHRTTWVIGLASAAVLVVAAWSPLSQWLQGDTPANTPSPKVVVSAAPESRVPAAPMRMPSDTAPVRSVAGDTAEKPTLTSNADRKATDATRERSVRAHAVRKPSQPVAQPAVAQPAQTQPNETAPITTDSIAATVPATDTIPSLQAQSARLEELVAVVRDERVGNASSELLSAELAAGIAAVDAALSRDELDDAGRQQLWQQRVDLLQQLAGVESTARWLAAQGMSNQTALVSVD